MLQKNTLRKIVRDEKQSIKNEVWDKFKMLETYEIPTSYLDFIKSK